MYFCRNCGEPYQTDDAVICVKCGCPKGQGNNFCPNCGKPVPQTSTVCLNCGVSLAPDANCNPNAKSKLAAGLLGIFLGGFGVHNFYLGYTTKAIIKKGKFSYNNIDASFTANQTVYAYEDYNGGRGNDDNDPIDLTKILFTMEANSTRTINVKIWLEGGDEDCDTTLANTMVNALIKFGSANVLRDAPILTANNSSRTITGLTTEMEYAYTNTETTIWNSVTNPSMTFNRGTTVYVRYKEVQGVSSYSYATKVVFN